MEVVWAWVWTGQHAQTPEVFRAMGRECISVWSMENVKLTLDGAEEDTLNCVRGWVILFTKGRLSARDEVAGSGPPLNLFLAVHLR